MHFPFYKFFWRPEQLTGVHIGQLPSHFGVSKYFHKDRPVNTSNKNKGHGNNAFKQEIRKGRWGIFITPFIIY
jgi:hypothetical protein